MFPSPNRDPTSSSIQGNVGGIASGWQAADASLARPNNATAYAANQTIGSSTAVLLTFTNFFRQKGSTGILIGARLIASVASIASTNMGAIRAHFYNAPPLLNYGSGALVDQSTWQSMLADETGKLGWADFATWSIGGANSDTIESYGAFPVSDMAIGAAASSANLYAVLEATGAFTPAANQVIQLYASALLD